MNTRQALEYVDNTAGGATVENFVEDWEPVGGLAWDMIHTAGYVETRAGKIFLTPLGEEKLAELVLGR